MSRPTPWHAPDMKVADAQPPTSGRTEAPYDVLTSRQALLEAAKLNREALNLLNLDIESNSEYRVVSATAASFAQVAQGLATYALAVDRWSP